MHSFPFQQAKGVSTESQRQPGQSAGAPPRYMPSVSGITPPPVFRPAASVALRKQQAPAAGNSPLAGSPPKYVPAVQRTAAPPVFRPMPVAVLRKQQTLAAYNPFSSVVNRFSVSGKSTIQRYCRNPYCTDPHCHDENNHGHSRVYGLRGRTVLVSDLGADGGGVSRGTGTTQETRDAVNSRPAPVSYRLQYSGGTTSGYTELDNPPSHSGRWDAGHTVGAQSGGYGDDPAAVFPQNAQYNRGNSYYGTRTYDDWRRHENNINTLARNGGVRQTLTLHNTPRTHYFDCATCGRTRDDAHACYHCGAL